jgi:hypothetical protein
MNATRLLLLSVCTTVMGLSGFAQTQTIPLNEPNYNKPGLFQQMPDTISVNLEILIGLLNSPIGNPVNANLSDNSNFQFQGQVVSYASKFANNIQSVVIRSANYPGATLNFSRISKSDGTVTYRGRILSFEHGDLYDLVTQGSRLFLVKKKFYDLVAE